jgi:hypothetical protein
MGCSCAEPELAQHLLAALASADGTASRVVTALASADGTASSSSPLVIYVSALGVDSTADCLPGQSVEVLRPWLTQKERAETILRLTSTPSDIIILRPGPLTDAAPSKTSVLAKPDDAASAKVYSPISRGDLAALISALCCEHKRGGGALKGELQGKTTWAVLDAAGVVISNPYMRRLEAWESLPFEAVTVG